MREHETTMGRRKRALAAGVLLLAAAPRHCRAEDAAADALGSLQSAVSLASTLEASASMEGASRTGADIQRALEGEGRPSAPPVAAGSPSGKRKPAARREERRREPSIVPALAALGREQRRAVGFALDNAFRPAVLALVAGIVLSAGLAAGTLAAWLSAPLTVPVSLAAGAAAAAAMALARRNGRSLTGRRWLDTAVLAGVGAAAGLACPPGVVFLGGGILAAKLANRLPW